MKRVIVAVGFVDKNWHTRPKGSVAELDEAYATTLIEQGIVRVEGDPVVEIPQEIAQETQNEEVKSTERKASKKNGRKKV